MHELTADFGTGLRAHLGLEWAEPTTLEVAFQRVDSALERAVVPPPTPELTSSASLDALEALEAELVERERALTAREASLAGRAGSLLAAAQALYDEVLGGPADHDDELARLRRRKSVA
jgi:hypothetical protein